MVYSINRIAIIIFFQKKTNTLLLQMYKFIPFKKNGIDFHISFRYSARFLQYIFLDPKIHFLFNFKQKIKISNISYILIEHIKVFKNLKSCDYKIYLKNMRRFIFLLSLINYI